MKARLGRAFLFVAKERTVKNLQEATERICELKGSLVALDALVPALLQALGAPTRARLMASFDAHAEAARTVLLYADVSDVVLATFERDVARNRAIALAGALPGQQAAASPVDALLLATARVTTYAGTSVLTNAGGFFFRRGHQLFLVSSRHVFADAASCHRPDRLEVGVHTDPLDLARCTVVALSLYRRDVRQWREADDTQVDIAALEIPADSLPAGAEVQAFDDTHLETRGERIATGDALTITGFAPGAHDTVHHLPVARSASLASAYGVRFQGRGCFLTDARTHCGSSGSPVLRRRLDDGARGASWQLIGVHSTRMDLCAHEPGDEPSPGLNGAWYADVLPALTAAA